MNPADAVELVRTAVLTAMLIGAPLLVMGMLVGLIISLLQALTQLLGFQRVFQAHAAEQLRGEVRDAGEAQRFAFSEGVADLDGAVVMQADDVASVGLFEHLADCGIVLDDQARRERSADLGGSAIAHVERNAVRVALTGRMGQCHSPSTSSSSTASTSKP